MSWVRWLRCWVCPIQSSAKVKCSSEKHLRPVWWGSILLEKMCWVAILLLQILKNVEGKNASNYSVEKWTMDQWPASIINPNQMFILGDSYGSFVVLNSFIIGRAPFHFLGHRWILWTPDPIIVSINLSINMDSTLLWTTLYVGIHHQISTANSLLFRRLSVYSACTNCNSYACKCGHLWSILTYNAVWCD